MAMTVPLISVRSMPSAPGPEEGIPATAELPYACPKCQGRFRRRCDLNKHDKKHTRLYRCHEKACEYHTKGFASSQDLSRHKDCHSDTKAWKCGCGYASRRKDNLNQHMKKKNHSVLYDRVGKKKQLHSSAATTTTCVSNKPLSSAMEMFQMGISSGTHNTVTSTGAGISIVDSCVPLQYDLLSPTSVSPWPSIVQQQAYLATLMGQVEGVLPHKANVTAPSVYPTHLDLTTKDMPHDHGDSPLQGYRYLGTGAAVSIRTGAEIASPLNPSFWDKFENQKTAVGDGNSVGQDDVVDIGVNEFSKPFPKTAEGHESLVFFILDLLYLQHFTSTSATSVAFPPGQAAPHAPGSPMSSHSPQLTFGPSIQLHVGLYGETHLEIFHTEAHDSMMAPNVLCQDNVSEQEIGQCLSPLLPASPIPASGSTMFVGTSNLVTASYAVGNGGTAAAVSPTNLVQQDGGFDDLGYADTLVTSWDGDSDIF